jgi:hypothetical protein
MTTTKDRLEDEAVFKFAPPLIQTAEDATQAYLRGFIDEDELRRALGKFGIIPGVILRQAAPNLEAIDAAFENKLPDDLYTDPTYAVPTLEEKLKMVDEKREQREKATKEDNEARKKRGLPVVDETVETPAEKTRREVAERLAADRTVEVKKASK